MMDDEFNLLDTPGTLTHIFRQPGKLLAEEAGSMRRTPVGTAALFTRLVQMGEANERGDLEAFEEAKDAALFEQGVITAIDALNGDVLSKKNLSELLRGKVPRALAVPAVVALATRFGFQALKPNAVPEDDTLLRIDPPDDEGRSVEWPTRAL